MKKPTRMERDYVRPDRSPADRLWGAQTQRSLQHFKISGERMPIELIHALAEVEARLRQVNLDLGQVRTAAKAEAIDRRRRRGDRRPS